jgi:hypothetical protein
MNFDLKVKDILKETYILTGKINDKNIINNLINFVKNNKDEKLSYLTNVKGHFTGFKSLIDNENFINFLKIIQENIKIIFKDNFIIQEVWGNLCKINDEIIEHDHSGVTGFCGILYLSENGPGTYFKEHDLLIKEEVGKYILFHPLLKHSVEKIKNDIERITIAFNMLTVKKWENYSNLTWVNKNEI